MDSPRPRKKHRMCDRLRQARVDAGLTQQELATKIGTSCTTVANIEHGRRGCSVAMLDAICVALGVDPGEMMRN